MENGDDEEAVRSVGDTSEGVVPGQECRKDAEGASGSGETNVWCAILEDQKGGAKEEEGEIQGEEE